MRKSVRILSSRIVALALLCAAAFLSLGFLSTASAEGPTPALIGDEISFDGLGAVLTGRDGGMPSELAIQNFASSGQSVRWAANAVPVPFCTTQAGRPSTITAQQFRDAVQMAADMWNSIEAAVGVHYTGDCVFTLRVELDNDRNEIGWDDSRNLVSGSQAGVTQGSWRSGFGRRDFTETDIVLDNNMRVPEACMRTVVAHEIGHAIGFGHSDDRGDLMFPSFSASNLSTCRPSATAAEAAWLVNLYGVNRKPVITPIGDRTVQASTLVMVSASATDPDGDPISFSWSQTRGTPVSLTSGGATVSFTAPPSGTVTLQVEVTDRYLKRATSVVTMTSATTGFTSAPATPSLQSILANEKRSASALSWDLVAGAQSHEFCVTQFTLTTCTAQAAATAEVGWATTLSAGGRADETTVLALDMRETGMRACNAVGCSAAGAGPLMGGLRWSNWGISYDVVAMAFDVPGTSIRFTIAGAVNLGISSRRFVLYSGPEEDPQRTMLKDCGILDPGRSCIGLLGPSDAGHGAFAVVESSALGTPGAIHRVRLR